MKEVKEKKTVNSRLEELEQSITALQFSVELSQNLLKRMLQTISRLDQDNVNTINVMNDIQYRTLAMLETSAFNKDEVDAIADSIKLRDFNDASDKEDLVKGLNVIDCVTETSCVIFTSTTDSETTPGVFRSKLFVSEIFDQELRNKFVGKKVNDTVVHNINEVEHTITILGIRGLTEVPVEKVEEAVACGNECGPAIE